MTFDIIIVGGGMVGAALACALRDTPLKIALIDATTSSDDPRLIALNDSSCCFLKNLNLWPQLITHAAPIHEVHVSYRGHFGTTHISAQEMHLETLGHVIPAKFINAALYDAMNTAKNIRIIRPATLKNFTQHENHVEVEINSQANPLTGRILIGADGSHSTVRKLLQIPTKIIDYHQSALVTTTTLQRSHHGIAYERFHPTGAIAMLPLSDNQVATIWTDSNANISALMKLDDADFLKTLQKNFGYRLGRLKNIGNRFTFPLQMIHAEQQIKQHAILIGNAAHTLHPIAAQGLNLALHEVDVLTKNFVQQNFCLENLFKNSQQQKASIGLSHYLPNLFTSDFFMVNTARQLGMMGLDICSTAKRRFVQHAIGRIPFAKFPQ